jgi:N-methylhydantoinase B
MKIDLATFNVISRAFMAISREMSTNLIRTAYSTVIREAADASTAILDPRGNTIAQAENIPLLLNSIGPALRVCLEKYPIREIAEDDFLIVNDPYSGGQHLSDVFIFTPVFHGGSIVAFAGSVGHHAELGGSPGFNIHARDLFMEKLRFVPTKLSFSRDWNGGLFEQIIRSNVRTPRDTVGDLNAQFTANSTCRKRLGDLLKKYGREAVVEAMAEYLDYAERWMRNEIQRVPDGVYRGEDKIDNDGRRDEPLPIRVAVEIQGSDIVVDFAGTCAQAETALNASWATTVSALNSTLKMILTPADLPFNEGFNRPITCRIPRGSILNPIDFAPCEGRMFAAIRVYAATMKALSQAVPEKVTATGFDTRTVVDLHYRSEGRYQAIMDLFGGGYGAGPNNDGADQLDDPLGNCRNTPVEALEVSQDYFRVLVYELIKDSGGAGKFRGGMGARRLYEILQDGVYVTIASDRFKFRPEGLFGGHDGTCASAAVLRGDCRIELASKTATSLKKGDLLEVRIGGGGGYGDPRRRERWRIEKDLREGNISAQAARRDYNYG